jgi:hypothetical protein
MDDDAVSARVIGAAIVMAGWLAVIGLNVYLAHASKPMFSATEIGRLRFIKWLRTREKAANDGRY